MALLVAAQVYQARFFCTWGVQCAINVRHYRVEDADGLTTDEDLAHLLSDSIGPSYRAILCDNAMYRGCGVQRISPLPKTLEVFSIEEQGAGSVVGEPLPGQVSGLISFKTALAGREYRGRAYVPFPSEVHNDETGLPTSGYFALLEQLGDDLEAPMTAFTAPKAATVIPVVWSKKFSSATPVVFTLPRQKWATQRRRGPFGAANASPI